MKGMMNMLEPRKRTALDGKEWWCVFDTDSNKWSTLLFFGKYKTKEACQYRINGYYHLQSIGMIKKKESEK